jgi:diguanylate cyclase (GGDEF)-like protein
LIRFNQAWHASACGGIVNKMLSTTFSHNTNNEQAVLVGNRIREKIQNLEFEENRKFKCTVSVGVYSGQPDSDRNIQHFIDNADQALYRAKESGRNRVMSL